MADINIAKDILKTYDEITVDYSRSNETVVIFQLFENQFALLCPTLENPASKATILVIDDSEFDFPHIMLREINIDGTSFLPKGKYRYVCLHEAGSLVASIQTYEEKIIDEIERLIELMQLSPVEIEKEYQKEFLYYWNSAASKSNVDLFLGNLQEFMPLKVYQGKDSFRYVSPMVNLSDIDEREKNDKVWQQRVDINAFYIPIIDNRRIIPPVKNQRWGISQIGEIINGKKISHISHETYKQLETQSVKYSIIDLVFSMNIESLPVTFAARITCKDSKAKPLLQKILEDAISVQGLYTKRQDYYYLNKVIGNTSCEYSKNVLLIGAGSLGSYVANEIVKNGFNQITVYDGDSLEPDNFMRWIYGGILNKTYKSTVIKTLLEWIHPEIHVSSNTEHIDDANLIKQMNKYEYIIFTVGSSDVQLKLNRVLKEHGCKAHTIFAWLEAGGIHSHILNINYENPGCYECLFTASDGGVVNNKANIMTEVAVDNNIIRNGCGGTRAAYGTAVLLRTTAALIDLIGKIENHELNSNCLIDITPDHVEYKFDAFVEKECRCCGNKT